MTESERATYYESYCNEITAQYASGHARENSYRPALERLMMSLDKVHAVNEPKHSEYGAPDFVFLSDNNHDLILGYAEAKDINVSLDKIEKTEQMSRYSGYANLFLTNYIEFRFFRNGEKYQTINIGSQTGGELHLDTNNGQRLLRELEGFINQTPEKIKNGKRLAQIMGGKARRIRDNVSAYLQKNDDIELAKIFRMMKKMLVHDLTKDQFADMYAQTLVYGLFVARYNDKSPDTFSRAEARDLVPKSNPFLRHFFDHIVGPDFDQRLGYIVDELCEIFLASNVNEIVHKHLRIADADLSVKDPIIHFYEDFLQEYNPSERKRMGAYYTPIPIVRYIIRQVDRILKEELKILEGLASNEMIEYEVETGQDMRSDRRTKALTKQLIRAPRVQILDPAVGTATFLNEAIKFIYSTFEDQLGRWPAYVNENLLKRLYGFELMMTPYTIAHLKLGMTLQETGVSNVRERLSIFLTNTLEEGIPTQSSLFDFGLAGAVSEESRLAAEVKNDKPVMVIIGNPPYSGVSSNETKYANGLISKYKVEPGGQTKLNERKHWLNDDYVKFIAFAEEMIQKNGKGVVAMITNNGYLDNPTFRGMRWRLATTFDKIYVLDLHGNTKKKETDPAGGKDENVFDIQQGVGIIIAVKTDSSAGQLAQVYHSELFGKRRHKFTKLSEDLSFTKLEYTAPMYDFVPRSTVGYAEYTAGIKLDELFNLGNIGICTQRDSIAIQQSREDLEKIITDMQSLNEHELRSKYSIKKDGRDWKLSTAMTDVRSVDGDNHYMRQINYRIFDKRWTFYTGKSKGFISYPRDKVFRHEKPSNLFLALSRQLAGRQFNHVFVSEIAFDQCYFSTATKEGQYAFPLYVYHDDGTRTANLNPSELKKLTANLSDKPAPEDVFDYVYGMLHMPKYRLQYNDFLKIDFPRVPVPSQREFTLIGSLGRELRELHLMKHNIEYDTTYPQPGNNTIEKLEYDGSKVWINDMQYFGNIPEIAWNFLIGGYQPAQKWLKDRKGSKLSDEDLRHYQSLIKILEETLRLMSALDSI